METCQVIIILHGNGIDIFTLFYYNILMKTKPRILHKCLRCGYEWLSRKEHPKVCARCRNPYWDKPRGNNK